MANRYDIGDVVRVTGTFQSTASVNADPTTVKFTHSVAGTTVANTVTYSASTGIITKSTVGVYYVDLTSTGAGVYEYRFSSTGTVSAAGEGFFYVKASRVL